MAREGVQGGGEARWSAEAVPSGECAAPAVRGTLLTVCCPLHIAFSMLVAIHGYHRMEGVVACEGAGLIEGGARRSRTYNIDRRITWQQLGDDLLTKANYDRHLLDPIF